MEHDGINLIDWEKNEMARSPSNTGGLCMNAHQTKIVRKYAKENDITVEQAINYMVTFLIQEMEN